MFAAKYLTHSSLPYQNASIMSAKCDEKVDVYSLPNSPGSIQICAAILAHGTDRTTSLHCPHLLLGRESVHAGKVSCPRAPTKALPKDLNNICQMWWHIRQNIAQMTDEEELEEYTCLIACMTSTGYSKPNSGTFNCPNCSWHLMLSSAGILGFVQYSLIFMDQFLRDLWTKEDMIWFVWPDLPWSNVQRSSSCTLALTTAPFTFCNVS